MTKRATDQTGEIVLETDVGLEIEMMIEAIVGEAVRGNIEAGEMIPAIGLAGGQMILLT